MGIFSSIKKLFFATESVAKSTMEKSADYVKEQTTEIADKAKEVFQDKAEDLKESTAGLREAISKKAEERIRLNLPDPSPIKSREVEWVIITPQNAEQIWKELKEKNVDVVLLGLTDDGYETLAVTIAELRNYIAQQRQIIIKYKEYYEPAQTPSSK